MKKNINWKLSNKKFQIQDFNFNPMVIFGFVHCYEYNGKGDKKSILLATLKNMLKIKNIPSYKF